MKNPTEKALTEGNPAKLLRGMAIPIFIAFLLNISFNIVDTIWVGNLLGENAVAALTVSYPLIILLNSFAMGATNGTTILISKYLGENEKEKAQKTHVTSLVLSVFISIILIFLCELGANKILSLLNTPSEIFSMAKDYLKIYLVGFFFVYIYLYLSAVLRSMGNTLTQMLFLLVSTIINIILDPLFINGFWVIPAMGIRGSAFATLISQGISVIIMIAYILKNHLLSFDIKKFNLTFAKKIIAKSVPSAIQQSIPAISTSFITALVSAFGITSIAAFGIAGKLEPILLYPAMALNMAITAAAGQCYGAKKDEKSKEFLHWGFIYGLGSVLILTALITLFAKSISGLFVNSQDIGTIVFTYFLIISAGYLFHVITNCYIGMINGLGKPLGAMLIMIVYFIIVRMPMAYLLSKTQLGIDGIWLAVLISHFIAMIASIICFIVFIKKRQKITACDSSETEQNMLFEKNEDKELGDENR